MRTSHYRHLALATLTSVAVVMHLKRSIYHS